MYKCQIIIVICSRDYNDGESYVLTKNKSKFELPNTFLESTIDQNLSNLFYNTMGYHQDWIDLKLASVKNTEDTVKIYYFCKVPKTEDNTLWVKTSVASMIDHELREIFLYV